MFELLLSIGGGFLFGSAINCIKDGVSINAFHSPGARADFEQKYGDDINRSIEQINWDVNDLNTHWFDE